MDNASARDMWKAYLDKHLGGVFLETPKTIHFFDNEKDANTSVELVHKGIKKATSKSLIVQQCKHEKLPKIGDFEVVTDWNGTAQCIIKTTKVRLKPFFSINTEYAQMEGEGDKSLNYWKFFYWDYFTRELKVFNRVPSESMIVVCQEFEKVF